MSSMSIASEKGGKTSSCTICSTHKIDCDVCYHSHETEQNPAFFSRANWKPLMALLFCIWCLVSLTGSIPSPLDPTFNLRSPKLKPSLQSCAWEKLKPHIALLDVPPIPRSEFLSRQKTLAKKLRKEKVDFHLTEPSASSTYYFNISTSYGLSERPFLSILSSSGEFSYLAPRFELGRISGLEMVTGKEGKKVIEWREEEDPFAVLGKELGVEKEIGKRKRVVVDDQVRFFIIAGLEKAGFDIFPVSQSIASIRSVKTAAELKILRGINEFTVEVIRSLQPCITVGMSQEEIFNAAKALFTNPGLGSAFWAIVLFGSQAATPHGGSYGQHLAAGDFILIDIGSTLHGYGSDVTRTILPHSSTPSSQLLDFWNLVLASQTAALAHMTPNTTCAAADAASREIYQERGYEEFYTHRLGHGLGLEIHEEPYLNGANGERLRGGQVVTNEPGFYVTDEQAKVRGWGEKGFGVRIEDAVVVTEEGGVVLTGQRARSPWLP
jgi:Xaa-Pro aminopeptidase